MQTQEEDAAMRLGPDDTTYSLQKPHFRNGMNFRSGAARSQGRRPHSQATCQKMLPKPPSHKKLQPQATPPKELTSDTEKSTYIYIYILLCVFGSLTRCVLRFGFALRQGIHIAPLAGLAKETQPYRVNQMTDAASKRSVAPTRHRKQGKASRRRRPSDWS